MKLIIGLGNPGIKYQNNRHNIGYRVIDAIVKEQNLSLTKSKLPLLHTKLRIDEKQVIVAKPLVYMNQSGEATIAIANYYKIKPSDIIILSDDFAINFARIRIRAKGSAGGHNGLKSIIRHLGTDNFIRIRIGIGKEDMQSYNSNYVLSDFSSSERKELPSIINRVVEAISTIITESVEKSMHEFN